MILGFGIAACGGELDPGAGNDPGTGTRTLAIDGSAHASAHLINARLNTDFDTEFSVRVSLADQTVTTGSVTVTSSTGIVALTFRDGRWTGESPVYDEVYILDVVSGPDKVEGVRVDGPDIHVFSQPTAGATIDAAAPLLIKWSRDDEADTASLRAEGLEAIAIPDTGSYSLPAGAIPSSPTEVRQHTLRLSRTNRVVAEGTASGSTWSVTVDNEIDVLTQPL